VKHVPVHVVARVAVDFAVGCAHDVPAALHTLLFSAMGFRFARFRIERNDLTCRAASPK